MSGRERLLQLLAPELVEALGQFVAEHVEERIATLHNGEGPAWLSLSEASAYCGVSERTLARWVQNGRLRSSTLGRRRLLSREDLDAELAGDGRRGRVSANRPTPPPSRKSRA